MATLSRAAYANLYGPTQGDRLRLGDTALLAEIEHDHAVYGEECTTGAGKSLRDGMGFQARATVASGALDMVVQNAVVIDPMLGIVKGDIGIRDGLIVAIGKAGNPDIQDGVTPGMRIGPATTVVHGEGLIATPGAVESHAHFICPQQCDHALASGTTTMIGMTLGPHFDVSCSGPNALAPLIRGADGYALNFGFLGRGSCADEAAIAESVAGGCLGVKIHEDFAATRAVINASLSLADRHDFQVHIHTDTLNEGGFVEDSLEAIAGRSIHMYHAEGAGGGHAPDIIKVCGESYVIPASTNPSNPFTPGALDEGLSMTMAAHALRWELPEDVIFAESRVRPGTMMAEDILHDMGAISIFATDSQGMGRLAENVTNCWQLASVMRDQRGRLPEERSRHGDNERIKRYIAKLTLNPAIAAGIDHYVGSLTPGRMADIVLWPFASFGAKPELVIKRGFVAWSVVGDAAGSIHCTEPTVQRPMWGSTGTAPWELGVTFVSQLALDADAPRRVGAQKAMLPIRNTRAVGKADMVHNNALPVIEVDPRTFAVRADGELLQTQPVTQVPLARRYFLR